jgi:nitrogen fixation/metabolism regulation signal transduction histidine kinase
MLVRSEREGAWREMAKQVAHEIKNPLTPMKLSIQHLQRSLRIDDADWKIKFDKTAKTIIDQIETLSAIAGEFSDFAKLPQPYFDSVDIVPLINQVIDLFKNETSELHFNTSQSIVLVRTDKDHFIRIMNNLLKNSIQAISNEIIGKIEITLSAVDDNCLIIVKDNGTGIPIELQSKIFMPNFTTKSAGTGLGLAMVKNMVEQSNGKIWFESSENIGTVFYIRFPLDHKTRNT